MLQILGLIDWNKIGFSILTGLYSTVARVYNFLLKLADYGAEEYNYFEITIEDVATTMYVLAGVFMLFRVTISMINMLIEPDKISDRQAGAGKVLTRVVTSLLMLILFVPTGWVFNKETGILVRIERAMFESDGLIDNLFQQINTSAKKNNNHTIFSDNVYAANNDKMECYYVYVASNKTNSNQYKNSNKTSSDKTHTKIYADELFLHVTFYNRPAKDGEKKLCINGTKDCEKYSYVIEKSDDGVFANPKNADKLKDEKNVFNKGWPSSCPPKITSTGIIMKLPKGKTWKSSGVTGYVGAWSSEEELYNNTSKKDDIVIYFSREFNKDVLAAMQRKTGIDNTSDGDPTSLEVSDEALSFAQHALGSFISCDSSSDNCEELKYGENGDPTTGMLASKTANKAIADQLGDEENAKMSMDFMVGVIAGVGLFVWIVFLCVELLIRKFKLILLEMIAPIPIISYSDPNDKMFSKWGDMYIKTYLDLFLKLFAVGFAIRLLQNVAIALKSSNGIEKLFFIVAILLFAKIIPDIISNIFGIKSSTGSFKDIKDMGKKTLGFGAGAAIGGAVGLSTGTGLGRIGGLAKGTIMGAGAGSKGNLTGGAKTVAATNTLKKQGLNWFDRIRYQGLGSLGIDPNISQRHALDQTKQAKTQIETIQGHIGAMDKSIDKTPEVEAFLREISNGAIKDPTGNKAKALREAFANAYDDGKQERFSFSDIENTDSYGKLDEAAKAALKNDYNKLFGENATLTISQDAWGNGYRTAKSAWLNGMELLREDKETVALLQDEKIGGTKAKVLLEEKYDMNTSYNTIASTVKGATFGPQGELNNLIAKQSQDLEFQERKSKASK